MMSHFENNASPADTSHHQLPHRDVLKAMRTGFRGKCPSCGEGALFKKYLKVTDNCSACGEELHHQRADDAPAYFTIAIVGKIIVGLFAWVELAYQPPYWVHAVIWTPLLFAMALTALPVIKGAIVGMQWANYMHGFDPNFIEDSDIEPDSSLALREQGAR